MAQLVEFQTTAPFQPTSISIRFVLSPILVNVEHIQPLEIHKPDVKPITTVAYDDAGMESED